MNENIKKEEKKQKEGEINTKMFRPITVSPVFVRRFILILRKDKNSR